MSEDNQSSGPPAVLSAHPSGQEPLIRQPRQPRNLQGLLRFAMEATRAEDAPGNSEIGPMDERRRRFLAEALRSLTVDVARVLQDAIKVLSDSEKIRAVGSGDDAPEDIMTAFTNIMDYVDDLDIANDFYKLGGFSIFPILLSAQCDEIRARACQLLAIVCQNNPFTQARALETGLLNVLINMAENENCNHVLAMTTYALSCVMREYEPACKEFIAQNGSSILLRLLNFNNIVVRTKAAFVIRYFCKFFADAREELLQKNLVPDLVRLLASPRNSSSEHILSALVVISDDPACLDHILNPELRLKEILEDYMTEANLKEDFDYLEEKQYCEDLLEVVKDVVSVSDQVER